MMKQNASFDASFWINVCVGSIEAYVVDYFNLFTSAEVASEIRYPLDILSIQSKSALIFNQWVNKKIIRVQNPKQPVSWFQRGENTPIALAIENNYFLLIDDANPYHRAKQAGIKIVGTADFIVFLYDRNEITHENAVESIQSIQINKKLNRKALVALETLKRFKEG